jgi:hypothetical protein
LTPDKSLVYTIRVLTERPKMNITTAQKRALEVIRNEYGYNPFSQPYDTSNGRHISKSTLRALSKNGYIEVNSVNENKYYVRGSFGRGNHYQKRQVEIVYKLVNTTP